MRRLPLLFALCFIYLAPAWCCGAVSRKDNLKLLLAIEKVQSGQLDSAKLILERLTASNPANDAANYYLGYVSASLNDLKTMSRSFEAAYRLDSTNIWYARSLASMYSAMHKLDEAEHLWTLILKKRPGDMDAMGNMVDIHIDRGRLDDADSLLNIIEMVNGSSGFTIVRKLEILKSRGRYDEFFSSLDSIMDSELPGGVKVDFLQSLMKTSDAAFNVNHLKDYDRLVSLCMERHPADTLVDYFAAGYYYTTRRYDESLGVCGRHPDDIKFMLTELSCFWAKDDDISALNSCDRLLEHPDADDQIKLSLLISKGDLLQKMGETSNAVKQYRKALSIDPDNATALNNYAYFMACRGKMLSKCEEMSRRALDIEPENVSFIDTYAWILYLRGKLSLARDYFKRAMLYGGRDNSEVLSHYATVLEALGDSTLAEEYRQRAAVKGKEK